jgi:hypothetical protein
LSFIYRGQSYKPNHWHVGDSSFKSIKVVLKSGIEKTERPRRRNNTTPFFASRLMTRNGLLLRQPAAAKSAPALFQLHEDESQSERLLKVV